MVDAVKLQTVTLFRRNFTTVGVVTIHEDQSISVDGTVEAKATFDRLPVRFRTVSGEFVLGIQDELTSLEGCPSTVLGYFKLSAPKLKSLEHAPVDVRGSFKVNSAALESLEHLPKEGSRSYMLTWWPRLPMLRLVDANAVKWGYSVKYGGISAGIPATQILDKYVGKGQNHMLELAAELSNAGFKANAQW